MNKPLIYISGKITGYPDYVKRFQECEDFVRQENIYNPINPAMEVDIILENYDIKVPTWTDYMKVALTLMMQKNCNDIILLTGWHKSEGAKIEMMYARSLEYKTHLYFHTIKGNNRRVELWEISSY